MNTKPTNENPQPPLADTPGSVPRLTKEQAVIVSAYTGYLCCHFGDMHTEIERRLGRPVWTHEMVVIMDTEIQPAFKDSFIALSPNDKLTGREQPPVTIPLKQTEPAAPGPVQRLVR